MFAQHFKKKKTPTFLTSLLLTKIPRAIKINRHSAAILLLRKLHIYECTVNTHSAYTSFTKLGVHVYVVVIDPHLTAFAASLSVEHNTKCLHQIVTQAGLVVG